MIDVNDFYSSDARASQFIRGRPNGPVVWDKVAPIQKCEAMKGKYYIRGVEHQMNWETVRAPTGPSNRVTSSLTLASYDTWEHDVSELISLEGQDPRLVDVVAANWINSIDAKAMTLKDIVNLRLEIELATKLHDTATYASTNRVTLSSSEDQYDDYNNSLPFDDFDAAQQAIINECGMGPNGVVIPWKVWRFLRRHPQMIGALKNVGGTQITTEQFAGLYGLDPSLVLITKSNKVTSNRAAGTIVRTPVWGNGIVFFMSMPADQIEVCTFGWHMQRPIPGSDDGSEIVEEAFDNERKAMIVRYRRSAKFNVVNANCAYLIKNPLASY